MAINIHEKDGHVRRIETPERGDASTVGTERVTQAAQQGALVMLRIALDDSEEAKKHYRAEQARKPA